MKKLISCLLAIMMLFTVVYAVAESEEELDANNVVRKFVDETDLKTKDIVLSVQSGENTADFVIGVDGDNLHMFTRANNEVSGHIQINPTGLYMGSKDGVLLLRFATVAKVITDTVKEVENLLDSIVKSIPETPAPTEAELQKALTELEGVISAAAAQEQADALTLNSAAVNFVNKFRPDAILNIKEDENSVEFSLNSEAYASALAEAMDDLMADPALAELIDRQAAQDGGKTFAQIQKRWNRKKEAILETIRSVVSTEKVGDDGHMTSHFQVAEKDEEVTKVVVCDSDAWIDAEAEKASVKICLGFENEEPALVYEFAVDPYSYQEKLTAGNSNVDVQLAFDDEMKIENGRVVTTIEGKEEQKAEFGRDYLYMKGPKGGISTTVRETWTGKTRVEIFAETAEGKESSFTIDFYEDGDSLVCELKSDADSESAIMKLSRIDKVAIDDLSASENITEITAEAYQAVLESLLKLAAPAGEEAETAK